MTIPILRVVKKLLSKDGLLNDTAGGVLAYSVIMTFRWLKNKINEMAKKRNAKRVVVGVVAKLLEGMNKAGKGTHISLKGLNEYSHFVVAIDSADQIIGEVELIKDQNDTLDAEVENLLGKDGLLVVEVS